MNWSQPAFQAVADLVSRRTGLTFAGRESSVELAVRRAMATAGEREPAQYVDRLEHDERVLDDLVSDLTIGETYFFREPDHFKRIRTEVLPDLRERLGADHVVRAWSAGCASGEEPYTLAIVLEQEQMGYHVLATDISHKALAAARRGVYGNWSLRGESGSDALPYLVRSNGAYSVADALRQHVTFAPLNLALDVYPSFQNAAWGMDLILCRNVLIYFDSDTVRNVAGRLFRSLSDGGWLITASADPPLWNLAPFEVVATRQGIIYRRPRGERGQKSEFGGWESEIGDQKSEVGAQRLEESGPVESSDSWLSMERLAVRDAGNGQTVVAGESIPSDVEQMRLLANRDPAEALVRCRKMLAEAPLSAELHFLHAMLLLDRGDEQQAIAAMRRVIYLDRSLAVAHWALAAMLRRRGDVQGARRGYRNVRVLCEQLAHDALLPLGEGERAGRLAELARTELFFLENEP